MHFLCGHPHEMSVFAREACLLVCSSVKFVCTHCACFVGLYQHDVVLNTHKTSLVSHMNKVFVYHWTPQSQSNKHVQQKAHSAFYSDLPFNLSPQPTSSVHQCSIILHDIIFQAANHVLRIILTYDKCLPLKGEN